MKRPNTEFKPNLNTPAEDLCKEELNKRHYADISADLHSDFQDGERSDIKWETEQIAKSHGIYLEFDRAKKGREKDWRYMVRLSIPGGGPLTGEHWQIIDDLAEDYCKDPYTAPSIRLTTRQNVQFHWIRKKDLVPLVRRAAEGGLVSLNGCGDNTRNIMCCPLAHLSTLANPYRYAVEAARYFELPVEPFIKVFEIDPAVFRANEPDQIRQVGQFKYGEALLNRKFKIGFSTAHRDPESGVVIPDNCVEVLTNDLGVVPVFEGDKHVAFQLYVGGGQGEKNGKPGMATLAKPLCIVEPDELIKTMDAVVAVHQQWGDRQNRHWARLKYVIREMGVDWYRERVEELLESKVTKANSSIDVGARELHFGWTRQELDGLWSYGLYIENGRLADGLFDLPLRSGLRELIGKYPVTYSITANQDLVIHNIPGEAKSDFESDIQRFGFESRSGKPVSRLRGLSGACVGRDTCRLTYTDSEKFEPELLADLESRGWGDLNASIGITGCERQCFRPATKTIGLIGTGLNRYQFKLNGSVDGRYQGLPLLSEDKTQIYLRSVPRERVADIIDALFLLHKEHAHEDEELGAFHRRVGTAWLVKVLSENEKVSDLLKPGPLKTLLEDDALSI